MKWGSVGKRWRKRVVLGALEAALWRACWGLVALGGLGGLGLLYQWQMELPDVAALRTVQMQAPLRILSAEGLLMAEFGEKRRIPVALREVPPLLIQAVLATEDHRFYDHPGVDLSGLLRAGAQFLMTGNKEQGGSTITMQVARNFFLSREKTFRRKINEILLAFKIEKELTKDEILNLYLNRIYFGKRAYGIAAAAEVYFGKSLTELTLAEMALLAGLPQAPSQLNPLNSHTQALSRRKHVLERMLREGIIDELACKTALKEPIRARYHAPHIELEAPFAAEWVRQQLFQEYGDSIYESGWAVQTTIQGALQDAASAALRKGLLDYTQRHAFRKPERKMKGSSSDWTRQLRQISNLGGLVPAAVISVNAQSLEVLDATGKTRLLPKDHLQNASRLVLDEIFQRGHLVYLEQKQSGWCLTQVPQIEGAFVAMNPDDGAVLALIGGFDFARSSFNRATQAERQPGSSFKPFVYSAALDHGFTLASVISDEPLVIEDPFSGPWRPKNDKDRSYGPSRLRVTLARSQNLPTIRLLQSVGIQRTVAHMKRFGFDERKLPAFLSLALGVGSATPLEMTTAYSVFANGGYKVTPYFIERIMKEEELLYQARGPRVPRGQEQPALEPPRAISKENAFLMTSALQDAIQMGTGSRAKSLGRRDLAGKTGTTNEFVDAWYVGFNRDLVATVWVGFDESKNIGEYGSQAALPIWIDFMGRVLKNRRESTLSQPTGVVKRYIDPSTGIPLPEPMPHESPALTEFFAVNVPAQPARIVGDASVPDLQSVDSGSEALF